MLSGAALTWQVGSWMFDDPSQPTRHGAAFLAFDIQAMMPRAEYERRIRHIVDEIHAAPTIAGVDRIMLPGEREWKHRHHAIANGLTIPADVVAKLDLLAESCQLPRLR